MKNLVHRESSLPNYFFPSSVFLYGDDPELCPSLVHLGSDVSKYGKFALFHAESLTGHATNIAVLDVDDKQLFPEETKSKDLLIERNVARDLVREKQKQLLIMLTMALLAVLNCKMSTSPHASIAPTSLLQEN
ncbi:hypothetical protein AAG906_022853 [Vitis piasezkii]